jgi:hypothetical protein
MEAKYNLTGDARKQLVNAVGEVLGQKPVYQGLPSAAYRIGDFTVDKEGTLSWMNDYNPAVVVRVIDGLAQRGFEFDINAAIADITSGLASANTADTSDITDTAVTTDFALQPDAEEWSEPATPENAPGIPGTPSDNINDDLPTHADEGDNDAVPDIMTISVPRAGFTPQSYDNLINLINSKAMLLQSAIDGFNLNIHEGIEDGQETLMFPWFPTTSDPDEVRAYTDLVEKLCEKAKTATRILARERPVPNPKFAFRVFLVRLGMVGETYRTSRQILTRHLNGCSAWRNGPPIKAAPSPVVETTEAGTMEIPHF